LNCYILSSLSLRISFRLNSQVKENLSQGKYCCNEFKRSSKEIIHEIMTDLAYQKQEFSSEEIFSYWSPIKALGQVDYLFARRKYTKAMMRRAKKNPVFDGKYKLKTILPEDLMGALPVC
jgi:hypothetical protein